MGQSVDVQSSIWAQVQLNTRLACSDFCATSELATDRQYSETKILMSIAVSNGVLDKNIAYQVEILEEVSRTFALTIPQLPENLRVAVGNAYLICRIADTIEDEPTLTAARKTEFSERFTEIVRGKGDAERFAVELSRELSSSTNDSEKDLVANTARVVEVTLRMNATQRCAIERCVTIMVGGMMQFQRNASVEGLKDLSDMNRYCYCVAGVVGEMLTELFCDHSTEINSKKGKLLPLSVSFGQGLQMTNILKDMWDDRKRGACWLPKDTFERNGLELGLISAGMDDPGLANGIRELVSVALRHLKDALDYVLLIPASEIGIRRHCLWALFFAVLTLRRIHATPTFVRGEDVKISRRSVKATIFAANLFARSDMSLKLLFGSLTHGIPQTGFEG